MKQGQVQMLLLISPWLIYLYLQFSSGAVNRSPNAEPGALLGPELLAMIV